LTHSLSLGIPRGFDAQGRNVAVEAVRSGRLSTVTVAFDVIDSEQVIGHEEFQFKVMTIRCREFDGP